MRYNYPPLQEPCKSAIEKGYCTGCNKLELENFVADRNCKYSKPPTATESIKQIKMNLGVENGKRT